MIQLNRRDALQKLAGLYGAANFLQGQQADPVLGPVNVMDFAAIAQKKMDPVAWDYLEGGSEEEASLRENIAGFRKIILRPKALTGVGNIDTALELFGNLPKIRNVLQTLEDVGLGYLSLGQSAPTLSGGEAQRVKLAAELARPSTGRTIYLLDEPTTGLHFDDIAKLLDVLNRLVDAGNTVLVVEHNLDVIKSADWVIDMGPEAGPGGGAVVVAGSPEEVVFSLPRELTSP